MKIEEVHNLKDLISFMITQDKTLFDMEKVEGGKKALYRACPKKEIDNFYAYGKIPDSLKPSSIQRHGYHL